MDKRRYIPRLIDKQVDFYLSTFGAVCLEGPKWCGKTWTARLHAKSSFMIADPADNFANRELARLDVSKALVGSPPHLIDEWQEIPALWDAVRYEVDQSPDAGRFILTGSSTPPSKGVVHSGTGRIASLKMHTMSLFERGVSAGVVSLADVCAGKDIGVQTVESPSVEALASFVVCGGWPGAVGKSPRQAALIPREYVENVIRIDARKVGGIERDSARIRKCLRSLARNESTTASTATIQRDIAETDDSSLGINTVTSCLDVFRRMFLTDDIEAFSTFLCSPARIKQAPKRHFCDPSIAAALLGASVPMLLRDLRTFGFLFESLALHDLAVYAQALDAKLFHYQDYDGREIDAVIQFPDDTWSAFEIKLNPAQVDEAAARLQKIASLFRHHPPASLSVIVGKAGMAYRRPDGVYVLPLTALRP